MDITQRIVIERECTRLVQRYCNFVDAYRAAAVSAFTCYGAERSDQTAVTSRVVGRWRDRFVPTAAGWRFAHRATDILFRSA